jgi:hypothetical protein
MPVVSVGQKLPSIYLDRFQPVDGLTYRISVLDTRAIATEFHFIDIPSRGIKGSYQCIQGVCCTACGRRSQTYNLPIYVYSNPSQSTEGEVQVWRLTAPQWKKFSDLAQTVDFLVYDIMLVAQKQGYGMNLSYSAVPDVKLREYWSAEQREQLSQMVVSFFQLGEASLVNPMTYNDWNQLLYDCGFDLQNMQWPGGQSPMNMGDARRSVGAAVVAPPLPPPPAGVLPPVPGMAPPPQQLGVLQQLAPQGVVSSWGNPIMQPVATISTPPGQFQGPGPSGPIPTAASLPVPGTVTIVPPVPSYAVASNPVFIQPVADQQVEHTSGYISREDPNVPSTTLAVSDPVVASQDVSGVQGGQAGPVLGVPLGTAPVIPQTLGVIQETFVAGPSLDVNKVPGQQEISMEEMNQLLS